MNQLELTSQQYGALIKNIEINRLPIYRVICDFFEVLILGGQISPNQHLPSIRKLAKKVEVNAVTVSKAYARLQSKGLVKKERGLGMLVIQNEVTQDHKKQTLQPTIDQLILQAQQLNIPKEELIDCINQNARKVSL